MKKKGFKLLALAVITACCFGISAASAFAADGETKTVMNGASIRTGDPTGLRFEAVVDKATYESVTAENNGKSFGAFILPKDYLTKANITEINNHKTQFAAVEKYLEKEDIAGELKGSEYVLKYSIAYLHYYNYNREFVGMFFIKTVGEDNTVSYQYFTVNAANNERSVSFVAKAAIENGSEVPDAAYDFAIAAKYLEAHPYDSTIGEETQKNTAYDYVSNNKESFKTAYTAIKAAAEIKVISIFDETQQPKIQAARTAYDGADTVIQNLLQDFDIYNKFVANEADYKAAATLGPVETVKNAIAALPEYNVSTVPVVYNKNYKTVKDAYDKLTAAEQGQITNYAKLKKYVDAAEKVKLIYDNTKYSVDNNTNSKPGDNQFNVDVENIPAELNEYGFISKVWFDDSVENVRLAFKNLPNLTGYDVVRFPIYLSPDQVGDKSYNLVYKFENENLANGYRTLTAGWNIVTIPVSKMYEEIQIGANMIPAKTIVYYAIPYAEKLESGDAIASYKYENNGVYIGGAIDEFTDAYRADVTFSSTQDNDYGTVINVKAEVSSWSSAAKNNYAFKSRNYSEIKSIVAETTGATAVKFKIKTNKAGTAVFMTEATSGHYNGIKRINFSSTAWIDVELTVEEFAKWNGYFRRADELSATSPVIELQLTDFTIVK